MLCGILQIAQTLAKFVGSDSPCLINTQYSSCNIQGGHGNTLCVYAGSILDFAYLHFFAVLVTKCICISYLSCSKIAVQKMDTHNQR